MGNAARIFRAAFSVLIRRGKSCIVESVGMRGRIRMVKAVIFDMYETLITHYHSPLYFSAQIAADAGIPVDKFQALWRPVEQKRTLG